MSTVVIVTETQNAAKSRQPFAGMWTTPFGRRVVCMLNQISKQMTVGTHIIQFKSSNPTGLKRNPQPFSLTLTRGRFVATFGWVDAADEQQFEQVDLGPSNQLEGRWTDFIIGMGPDIGNTIVVYKNGQKIVSRPMRYLDAVDTYLKYGIYRYKGDFTNVLVWDEIRLGASKDDVGLDLNNPVD